MTSNAVTRCRDYEGHQASVAVPAVTGLSRVRSDGSP